MSTITNKKIIIIIYPAAHDPSNVGSFRAMRMVRSLLSEDREIVLITADSREYIKKTSWGFLISTGSGLWGDFRNFVKQNTVFNFAKNIKSKLAGILIQPDGNVVWNKMVLKDARLEDYFRNCSCVVTTSPPNSVHLLGKALKEKYGCKWVMDMRDGWRDEPLAPKKGVVGFFDKVLERKCLNYADNIILNTIKWRDLVVGRYPKLKSKTSIITNSVDDELIAISHGSSIDVEIEKKYLLYAGAFTKSDFKRKPEYLLEPLINSMGSEHEVKKILLVGRMSEYDLKVICKFSQIAERKGVVVEVKGQVSRHEVVRYTQNASGLLILSSSLAALPAKFFDYLPAPRPILSFCYNSSSLCYYSKLVESVYTYCIDHNSSVDTYIKEFLVESSKSSLNRVIPEVFTENYFSDRLNQIVSS